MTIKFRKPMKLGVVGESWLRHDVLGRECTAATCLYFFCTFWVGGAAGFDPTSEPFACEWPDLLVMQVKVPNSHWQELTFEEELMLWCMWEQQREHAKEEIFGKGWRGRMLSGVWDGKARWMKLGHSCKWMRQKEMTLDRREGEKKVD